MNICINIEGKDHCTVTTYETLFRSLGKLHSCICFIVCYIVGAKYPQRALALVMSMKIRSIEATCPQNACSPETVPLRIVARILLMCELFSIMDSTRVHHKSMEVSLPECRLAVKTRMKK